MIDLLKDKKAFSLVELLVVIGIIALLSTFSVVMVGVAREKSKIASAQHDIDQIYKAISMMANNTGEWPGHATVDVVCASCSNNEICGPDVNANDCVTGGLDDPIAGIVLNDTVTPYSAWDGPYMLNMPIDPWGYEYFFDTDYEVKNTDATSCDGGVVPVDCHNAVVVGSYGPDREGRPSTGVAGAYGADDIIKIIK